MEWIKVLDDAGTLAEGSVMEVNAGVLPLALSKVNGTICAIGGVCPHEGGPLGKGSIENGRVVCPWHGMAFDSCSGKNAYKPESGVDSFAVEVRDDGVYVAVPSDS